MGQSSLPHAIGISFKHMCSAVGLQCVPWHMVRAELINGPHLIPEFVRIALGHGLHASLCAWYTLSDCQAYKPLQAFGAPAQENTFVASLQYDSSQRSQRGGLA